MRILLIFLLLFFNTGLYKRSFCLAKQKVHQKFYDFLESWVMDSETSLAYIAHYVSNIASMAGTSQLRSYFSKVLGTSGKALFAVDDAELAKLARHLYRSHVVAVYSKYDAFYLASHLTDKQLEGYLADLLTLEKKYGIVYDTISTDLSKAAIDKHIKKNGETRFKSILAKLDPMNSPTTIKAKASAARLKAKEAKLKAAGKSTASTTKKTTTSSRTKKAASPVKKTSTKSTTTKKTTRKPTKSCNDHNLKELKEMAKAAGMTGYSKLDKSSLCKKLNIK